MAGLWDFLQGDDATLGLALLGAGGPTTDPNAAGFGARLAGAVGSARAQQAQQAQRGMQLRLMQSQVDENAAQAQARNATWQNGMLKQQVGARVAADMQAGKPLDVQALVSAGFKPEEIAAFGNLRNVDLPEVARTVETMGPNGAPVTKQFDKQGREVGAALPAWKAPIHIDRGNSIDFLTGATLQPLGSMSKTQTPDSAASIASQQAIAGQTDTRQRDLAAMTDARMREANETARSTGRTPLNYRWKADGSGVEPIPGGPADPNTPAAGKNLTEDQGKATGWLVQAENAYSNMLKTGFDRDAQGKLIVKSAAKPGINDALEKLPLIGGGANALRGADRQQFMQASSSLSEALLRAATGAGVNANEAKQKIDELTPKFGEREETTRQKMESIPLYLESLKIRAGAGGPKAEQVLSKGATKTVDVGGQKMTAQRAADGNFYVKQANGKWARVNE
jgi:hypothetical protein